MSQTVERQIARNSWIQIVADAWSSLGRDAQEHCISLSNLNRWWPGTQPTEQEPTLRQEMTA